MIKKEKNGNNKINQQFISNHGGKFEKQFCACCRHNASKGKERNGK